MKKGPNLRWSLIQCSGGDEGDRTPDLLTASQALSQLSYAPVRRSTIRELPRRCKDNFGKTFCGRRGTAGASPPPARGHGIGPDRAPHRPAATKPCRITGLDAQSPSVPRFGKTKPQADGLPIFKLRGYGRPCRAGPRNPAWF